MTPERWSEIRKVFGAALETPKQERPQFLGSACGADGELRAEVERLLAGNEEPSWQSPVAKLFPVAAELAPGAAVAQYRIIAKLGAGGMGVVYKAYDTRLDREVAVKVLPPGHLAQREARAASALNHPNIVCVHEFGDDGGLSFIVSELVDGETLVPVIQRGPLALRKLIDLSSQICDGLAAAHAVGVVHRDLKPGNIMVSRDGRVKILDFGLARQDRAHGTDSTTMDASHPGMIMGTPGYMSPEQARGEPTDARSDIFSLGVILYEMASRHRAFPGTSSIEVMNAIIKDEPPDLPAASPPTLGRVVRRCLEKEPARRFQTTADLGFALHSLAAPPLPETAPKARGWLKWLALATATTVTGVAIYWLGLHLRKPVAPPELSLRRLTSDERLSFAPAISPDGKLVAYTSNRADPDHFDIWVQQIDGGGAIRLTDDPANHWSPAFSPDGSHIGFRSDRDKGGIYLVPTLGGEAREVVPQGKAPSFSPDGRWLMYSTGQAIQVNGELFIQALSGGPPAQIGKGTMVCQAVWSPDGRRILFWADCDTIGPIEGIDAARPSLWVYDVEEKELKRVYDPGLVRINQQEVVAQWVDNPSRLLTWTKVADAFVVTATPVSADGTRVTGTPQKLASVTDRVSSVSAASNGRIVFSIETSKFHAWGLPIDANGRATGSPKPLASGPERTFNPLLSKDGLKLTYMFFRSNGCTLLYKNLTTEREREVYANGDCNSPVFNSDGTGLFHINPAGIAFTPVSSGLTKQIWNKRYALMDLSPDGKTLLFLKEYPDKPIWGLIWRLDLDSLRETALVEDPELDVWQGQFSRDGRWLTFNASTKDGIRSRVYVVQFRKSFLPRSEWIELTHGEWDDKPRFSADDRMIFFRSGANGAPHRLWAQKLTSEKRPYGNPVEIYSPDRRYIMDDDEMTVGPQLIAFDLGELSGNIWLLEPAKGDPK